MGFLAKLFGGPAYPDEKLVEQARIAIDTDPLIEDPAGLVVTSSKGVISLTGIVHKQQEKDRIEGVIRNAYTKMGLKHERLINELQVQRPRL